MHLKCIDREHLDLIYFEFILISFEFCYIPGSLHIRKWPIMTDLQTTDMAPILHSLGDKRGFMILPKFSKLGLFSTNSRNICYYGSNNLYVVTSKLGLLL